MIDLKHLFGVSISRIKELFDLFAKSGYDLNQNSDWKEIKRKFFNIVELNTLKDFPSAEEIAKIFHNNYEQYAVENGWKTQAQCQVHFDSLPEANKKTMIDVAELIRGWILRWQKQEAIKIIKEIESNKVMAFSDCILCKNTNERAFVRGFIKWQNNITEEELK